MKIMVSGLVNIETTVAIRQFPIEYYPIDYPFFGVNSRVSGVGYNVAKALGKLGDQVKLNGLIGKDDEAVRILNCLEREGMKTDYLIPRLKQTPSSVVLYTPDGKRQIYCDLKDIQEQKLQPKEYMKELSDCDAAVLCNINFNRSLIKEARTQKVLTATDVHVLEGVEDDYNRDFMENADILFLSDEKLPENPEIFIKKLFERYHNQIIVIGMGEKGALLLNSSSQQITRVPSYHHDKIVNTVGAGDALFSSFLHFYLKGKDSVTALKKAVIFAGVKICSNGASNGFSTEKDTEAIFQKQQ